MSRKNSRANKKSDLKTVKTKDLYETEMTAMAIDGDWFRTHPGRSHRVRRALPQEFLSSSEGKSYIVVRQLVPGVRMRASLSTLVALPDEDPPEPVAHAIFDFAQEKPGQCVSVAELYYRIYVYSAGGDLSGGVGSIVH
jgi:hypothetical protein